MDDRLSSPDRQVRRQARLDAYRNTPDERLVTMRRSRLDRLARIQEHGLPESVETTEREMIEDVEEAMRSRGLL